jgi:hypothetical protein
MIPKKPDEPYGLGELIAVIVNHGSENPHTSFIYSKDILCEGDSRISNTVIGDQFAMWLKYQKYRQ